MSLNPNIPLQAEPIDLASVANRMARNREHSDNLELRKEALKMQQQRQENHNKLTEQQIAQTKFKNLGEREQRRLKSSVIGAAELFPHLQNNDLETTRSILEQRRKNLGNQIAEGREVDTAETDEMLQMLQEDPEQLKSLVQGSISLGNRLGFLKQQGKEEGFTLKQGEQRFDAQGNQIASVDAAQEKAPTGYKYKNNGNLEAIPGGPVDIEQKQLQEKQQNSENLARSKAELVINNVDRAISEIPTRGEWFGTSGFFGKASSFMPGSDGYDVNNTLNTIKANLGFDTLQQMREASPTGGALGSVSERELDLLTSAISSLNIGQSEAQLIENLKAVRKHYDNWKDTTKGINPYTRGNDNQSPAGNSNNQIEFLGFE